jgi:hypothetical protein
MDQNSEPKPVEQAPDINFSETEVVAAMASLRIFTAAMTQAAKQIELTLQRASQAALSGQAKLKEIQESAKPKE